MSTFISARRARRRASGGTFLVAVALAVQLGQNGALADDNLILSMPVAIVGALLIGLALSSWTAVAMSAATASGLWTLAAAQTGQGHADALLYFAIPLGAAAAIVVCHRRRLSGKAAIGLASLMAALIFGVGHASTPLPFAVAYFATLISLPNVPLR
jgi:uncharacterized membrane protein YkvI